MFPSAFILLAEGHAVLGREKGDEMIKDDPIEVCIRIRLVVCAKAEPFGDCEIPISRAEQLSRANPSPRDPPDPPIVATVKGSPRAAFLKNRFSLEPVPKQNGQRS